ncbi:hypothetical protein TWF506_001796 [Arthrobotrys conoides]|uniref:Uncharacterized protein n=1 Tax=Arthrobotrys conoides TaxID=74498 RepID=A0AAN8NTQ8_9PEZI
MSAELLLLFSQISLGELPISKDDTVPSPNNTIPANSRNSKDSTKEITQLLIHALVLTPPPTPLVLQTPEISNLYILEKHMNLTYFELGTRTSLILKSNPERLTGRKSIISMHRSSAQIERKCRYLDSHDDLTIDHCSFVHRVMVKIEHAFQPYFLCERETYYTKYMMETLETYSAWFMQAREQVDRLEKGDITSIPAEGTNLLITKDNMSVYLECLQRLDSLLVICHKTFARRIGYLNEEKRGIVRLLSACRRFKAIQKNRLGRGYKPCICRIKEWDREAWTRLGLPVISVPAGSRGFAPI